MSVFKKTGPAATPVPKVEPNPSDLNLENILPSDKAVADDNSVPVIADEERKRIQIAKEAAAKAKADRVKYDSDVEHLRFAHGFFVGARAGKSTIDLCHARDHAKEKKTPFYKAHTHNGESTTVDVPDSVPVEWTSGEEVFHP